MSIELRENGVLESPQRVRDGVELIIATREAYQSWLSLSPGGLHHKYAGWLNWQGQACCC
jgi:hypothetical protein